MVWWINKIRTLCLRHTPHNSYNIREDRLLQSISIIFNCRRENYITDDISSLLSSGVNIFNVDLGVHSTKFRHRLFELINRARQMPEMVVQMYPRPVALSVTMSVNNIIDIDEEVDIVILKDVLEEGQVSEFKARNSNFRGRILFWFLINCTEYVNDLIRISDGIVLECSNYSMDFTADVFDTCKKARKPLFCLNPGISEEILGDCDSKRKFMATASEIINEKIDGIFINGTESSTLVETEIVRTVTEATELFETRCIPEKDYTIMRSRFKEPQLATMGVMIAASLAALKYKATAIVLLTASGASARLISRASPPCHVIAITAKESTARIMHLYRKIIPLYYNRARAINWRVECRNRVLFGTEFAEKSGLFGGGAKLVVLASTTEGVGYCDGFQIVTVPFGVLDQMCIE